MSAKRHFRVYLNLSEFFRDRRSKARVYINDDIKKISDLAYRIEDIFDIKNFRLAIQNEYLSHSEDVQILEDNEMIWVVRNGDQPDKSASTSRKRAISPTRGRLKEPRIKRKGKQLAVAFLGIKIISVELDDAMLKFRDHLRYLLELRRFPVTEIVEVESTPSPEGEAQPPKKKMPQSVDVLKTETTASPEVKAGKSVGDQATTEMETEERTDTSEATFGEAMDVPRDVSMEYNTSITSDTGLGSFPSFSRNPSTEFEGDDTCDLNNPLDQTIKPSDNSMLDLNRYDESFSSKISTISRKMSRVSPCMRVFGVGQCLMDLRSNSSFGSVNDLNSDCSESTKRRRRKRAQRRKKKNESGTTDTSTSSSVVRANCSSPPKPKHTIFKEGDNGVLIPVNKVRNRRNSVAESEPCSEGSSVGSVILNRGKEHQISEEDILKAPFMKDSRLPKAGDIMAFKVLIITEDFTPGLTSQIIGKVSQYDAEHEKVVYRILSGLDQCDAAALEVWPGSEKIKAKVNRRVVAWKDVMDARLLTL